MPSRADPSFETFNDGSYTRIPCNPIWYHDCHVSYLIGCQNNGYQYFLHEAFARVRITTNAPDIKVEAICDTVNPGDGAGFDSTGLMLNGAPVGDGAWISTIGGPIATLTTYSGLTGTNTLDLVEGPRSNLGFGGLPHGTPILAFWIPNGYTYSVVMPTAPAKRIVVYGDSITVGEAVTDSPNKSACYQAWPMLARANALVSGAGAFAGASVLVDGSGWARWNDITSATSLVNDALYRLARQCDGTVSNKIVFDLGTNDYGSGLLASTFQTNVASFLDALHTALPNALVLISTPRTRGSENTPNASGSTLPDFRTALATVQSTRSSYCDIISGPSLVTYPTNFVADQIHMKTAGHAQNEANIRSTIGY